MEDSGLRFQIEKLNQIGIALTSETNVKRLLDLIVREARGFTGADAGSLYIKSNNSLQFEVVQNDTLEHRGCEELEQFKPFPLPLTRKSIAGNVALTGEILNIEDVEQLDDTVEFFFNVDFDRRNGYHSKSMLAVPMKDQNGSVLGVLQLINALDENGRIIPFGTDYEALVLSLASQAAVAFRNARLLASIKNLFASLVRYSASAIDARSPHTAGHSRRVASLANLLAEAINREKQGAFADVHFSPDELEELSYAAWLHDIGKIGVRESVLEKTTKITPDRLAVIRSRFNEINLCLRLVFEKEIAPIRAGEDRNPEKVMELSAERDRLIAEVEADWIRIEKWNLPGFLTDEDLAALERIGAKTYTTPDGEQRPYLDDFERSNLSVRKGNLTTAEYQEIQSHVTHTERIVSKIPFTPELAKIPFFAAAHHEMLDGTGYPKGLKGDDIPLQARILGVVDIFDALVARDRPYKKAMPLDKALNILKEEAAHGRLDPDLVDLFIRYDIGSEKNLNYRNNDRDANNHN